MDHSSAKRKEDKSARYNNFLLWFHTFPHYCDTDLQQ